MFMAEAFVSLGIRVCCYIALKSHCRSTSNLPIFSSTGLPSSVERERGVGAGYCLVPQFTSGDTGLFVQAKRLFVQDVTSLVTCLPDPILGDWCEGPLHLRNRRCGRVDFWWVSTDSCILLTPSL